MWDREEKGKDGEGQKGKGMKEWEGKWAFPALFLLQLNHCLSHIAAESIDYAAENSRA